MKHCIFIIVCILLMFKAAPAQEQTPKQIAYVVSDTRIPFWDIMKRGLFKRRLWQRDMRCLCTVRKTTAKPS